MCLTRCASVVRGPTVDRGEDPFKMRGEPFVTPFAKRLALCLAMVVAVLGPAGVAAQTAEPQAWDGSHLSDQPAAVQAMFQGAWGDKAAQQWAKEHSTALLKAVSAPHGVPVAATSVIADGPPIAADTMVVDHDQRPDQCADDYSEPPGGLRPDQSRGLHPRWWPGFLHESSLSKEPPNVSIRPVEAPPAGDV
jgi:hypothetical protein